METANRNATDNVRPRRMLALRALEQGLLVATLGIVGVAPVMAAAPEVPAIVEPSSQEAHIGKVIFVELVTPDLGVAEKFYAALFGWTFRDTPIAGAEYAEAYLGGDPVAGLVHKPVPAGEHRQPAWLTFFAVHDVDVTEKMAVQRGAKVLAEPHPRPARGRQAVLADPQGAVFALLSSSSGDPPDVLAAPGAWIWSSLITSDPDTDTAFYQALFDYEVFDLPADAGAQHVLLATESYARASVNSLPAKRPNMHPHWLNYVRVDDAAAMAAKVVGLGGRVLVEPRTDRHGGKVAVVADPLGAPFGLLEWSDAESKEVPK